MHCNIQVSDINASRTQHSTTHSRTLGGQADGRTDRVNHRHHHHRDASGHPHTQHTHTHAHAGIRGSYGCQDECHIIAAPKMVSKRHQRRFSPSAVKLQTENRTCTVVIRMSYELCPAGAEGGAPALAPSPQHQTSVHSSHSVTWS